jgi:hypothetical protein
MALIAAIVFAAMSLVVVSHITVAFVIVIGSDDVTRRYQEKSGNRAESGDSLQRVHDDLLHSPGTTISCRKQSGISLNDWPSEDGP